MIAEAARRRPALTAGLLAALAHALFWLALPASMQRNQSTDYFEVNEPVARQIAAGHGITTPAGTPASAKSPGQSILLAGCFWLAGATGLSEDLVLRLYVVGTMGVAAGLLYRLFLVLLSPRVALWGVVLWTLHPMTLWIAKQPNTEVPFFAFFFGALLAAGTHGLLCGLLLGMAMLIRPIGLLLPAVLLVWLWLDARWPWRRLAIFGVTLVAGCALAVGPWEIWVHQKTGRWILLSEHGTASLMDGLTFGVKGGDMGATLVRAELLPLMQDMLDEQIAGRMDTNVQVFSYLGRRLREEPALVVELFAVKTLRSWFGTNGKWMELAIALVQLPFVLLAGRGLWQFWRAGDRERSFGLLCLLLTGYFWAMTVTALSIVRYLLPPMAVLCAAVAAGAGLTRAPGSAERPAEKG